MTGQGQGGRNRSHRGLWRTSRRIDCGAEAGWTFASSPCPEARQAGLFVGKYELGERRLDVVELMVILKQLELSFDSFWTQAKVILPERL